MPLTLNSQPVSQAVKAETEVLHREVEDALLPRLQKISSAESYAAILKMFWGYFYPLEKCIQQFISPEVLPDIAKRRTASLIVKDLEQLGVNATDLPISQSLPNITNQAEAFGALYVMEGSTLGGKMIAKMLAKNKAYSVSQEALNFFNGYGTETGPMWTNFLQVLNNQQETNTIIQAANETFLHLKAWMLQTDFNETTH